MSAKALRFTSSQDAASPITISQEESRFLQYEKSSIASNSPSLERMQNCRYPTRLAIPSNPSIKQRGSNKTISSSIFKSLMIATLFRRSFLQMVQAEENFSGEWNGEWKASQSNDWSNARHADDDDDYDVRGPYSMWKDDGKHHMSPELLITLLSTASIIAMIVLCFICYPEFVILLFNMIRQKCCSGGLNSTVDSNGFIEHAVGKEHGESVTEYTGGKQKNKKASVNKKKGLDFEMV